MVKAPKRKDVELDHIFLDLENPRHEPYEKQSQVIDYLCRYENVYQLAKDIVAHGLNPLELFALIPDEDEPNAKSPAYFVAEGNRRVCALKLLDDPDLAPPKLRKSFEAVAVDWTPIGKISCVLFEDRPAVDLWLSRIHNGEQGGIGRRKWNADQSARHSGDNKNKVALAVLDHAEAGGIIDAEGRKGKLTTVQRYMANRLVREAMGVDSNNPEDVSRNRTNADFELLLRKFVDDLLRGHVNSRAKKDHIEAYSRELGATGGQSHNRVEPVSLKKPDDADKGKTRKRRKPRKPKKRQFIDYEDEIMTALEGLSGDKLPHLYNSICSVSLESHTPLVAIGVWAFLESLSAKAGRGAQSDFLSFFNKSRLQNYGISKGKGDKSYQEALRRVSASGDVTKHDGVAALFNGDQLANDMDTLKNLVLNCIDEASSKA